LIWGNTPGLFKFGQSICYTLEYRAVHVEEKGFNHALKFNGFGWQTIILGNNPQKCWYLPQKPNSKTSNLRLYLSGEKSVRKYGNKKTSSQGRLEAIQLEV
jgi:hypothetical protein